MDILVYISLQNVRPCFLGWFIIEKTPLKMLEEKLSREYDIVVCFDFRRTRIWTDLRSLRVHLYSGKFI